MSAITWLIEHWAGTVESTGIIGGLFFTGLSLRIDARTRRAETLIEITKQHRELWTYFHDHEELGALFDAERKIDDDPVTSQEAAFVNLLLNHLRATFHAHNARIYSHAENLPIDIRVFLSYPATRHVWDTQRKWHDRRFVAFVEESARAE
jgi:hypothetical protein